MKRKIGDKIKLRTDKATARQLYKTGFLSYEEIAVLCEQEGTLEKRPDETSWSIRNAAWSVRFPLFPNFTLTICEELFKEWAGTERSAPYRSPYQERPAFPFLHQYHS